MNRTIKDWLLLLAALADDAAILAAVILILHFLHIPVPWWAYLIIVLAVAAFAYVIHKKVIPALHRSKTTGSEGMIGLHGEATQTLAPNGMVRVKGELWNAKSEEGHIAAGRQVKITGIDGLLLKVVPEDDKGYSIGKPE